LRGVTVPVHLTGPFDAIDWKVQWSGVAAAAVEHKLKDKIAETLGVLGRPADAAASSAAASAPAPSQRPEDTLKDRLRSLLGR